MQVSFGSWLYYEPQVPNTTNPMPRQLLEANIEFIKFECMHYGLQTHTSNLTRFLQYSPPVVRNGKSLSCLSGR